MFNNVYKNTSFSKKIQIQNLSLGFLLSCILISVVCVVCVVCACMCVVTSNISTSHLKMLKCLNVYVFNLSCWKSFSKKIKISCISFKSLYGKKKSCILKISQTRFFPKNQSIHVFTPYTPLTSCTVSQKTLEPILRKSL